MRNLVIGSCLALGAAVLVPVAFLATEGSVPAADHLDPPGRTNPNNDATPDFAADIADLYVTHNADFITLTVTFGGPASPSLPAYYDRNVRYTIAISNAPPRTSTEIPIVFQFGQEAGVANGPWGVRVKNIPGVQGDVVGSVERILQKDGVRVFAGLVDDPFFFDSQGLTETRNTGTLSFRSTRNFFGAQNITALVIEIPRSRLENGNTPLEFWTFSERIGGQI